MGKKVIVRKNCYNLSVLSLILAIVILIAQILFTGLLGIDLIKSYWVLFFMDVLLIVLAIGLGLFSVLKHKKFAKIEWVSVWLVISSVGVLFLTFILELILKP